MNGYVRSTYVYRRISNLIEQIPQEVRLNVARDCIPADGNIHDWERKLTGVCLRKDWEKSQIWQIGADGLSSPEWWNEQKEIEL